RVHQQVAAATDVRGAAHVQHVAGKLHMTAVGAHAGRHDLGGVGEVGDAVTLQHDVAAGLAGKHGLGIEGTGVDDVAAGGGEEDVAVVLVDAAGLDQAGVVHHRGLEGVGHVGGHDDGATVGQQL